MDLRERLLDIYRRLFQHFGHQEWWPGDTPFEVMVGAILTQNTSWKNVERTILRLKQEGVFEAHKLYALEPPVLAELLRPVGYFNVKTKRLRAFLKVLVEDYNGDVQAVLDKPLRVLREELLAIKGIGPETADCMVLYASEQPIFVIDAYTIRSFSRMGLLDEDCGYDDAQALFMSVLDHDVALFNDFHAQIVYLGKDFCRPRPKCHDCPVRDVCDYAKANAPEA